VDDGERSPPRIATLREWIGKIARDCRAASSVAGSSFGQFTSRWPIGYRTHVCGVRLPRVPLGRLHCTRFDGLPITDRCRTVIDFLRSEPYGSARDLLDRALQQRWLADLDLMEAVRAEPGRAGNVQIRRLLAEIVPGAQAESERRLHRLLHRHGITGWVRPDPAT
jgi:hypothetical protein